MNDEELNSLYHELLRTLVKNVPRVAEQIEETVRQGRPVARQVRRSKSGSETVALVPSPLKLRDDQFAATEELTANERVMIALTAIERLLIDPPQIEKATRETMERVKVSELQFAEPFEEGEEPPTRISLSFEKHSRLADLLERVRSEIVDVR